MKLCYVFLFLSFSLFAKLPNQETVLKLAQVYESSSALEISGFAFKDNQLFAVSDNAWDTWLYGLELRKKNAIISKTQNLKKLKGYWVYYLSTFFWRDGERLIKAPWDLEGAAVCGDELYLVNEQTRHVLKIANESIEKIEIDFRPVFKEMGSPLNTLSANAGFEGVAVDCANSTLYIAQERSPRAILTVDLKQRSVSNYFDTSTENNPNPDYADLYFTQGHLYVLERNMRRVLKVSPAAQEVVAVASYEEIVPGFLAADLYETGEVFGLGEALYMDEKFIYIGNDNNGNPFSEMAKERFGLEGNNSTILKFQRPQGF